VVALHAINCIQNYFPPLHIGLIYDKENCPSDLFLSVLEYRIDKVETDERTVKALEKDAGDEKQQMTVNLVRQCKKLLDLVREWPRKQDDVEYFIDSMDNIVAIIKVLCVMSVDQ